MSTTEVQVTAEDPGAPGAQYFAELDRRFDPGYDPAAALPCELDEMRPPAGIFLMVTFDGEPVGCGALKFHAGDVAELKRMWVSPTMRGMGIGRRLLEELEHRAAEVQAGGAVRLDTNHSLTEAIALYLSTGYRPVAPFNNDPYADRWFEKKLGRPAP